jgi:ComF family protein
VLSRLLALALPAPCLACRRPLPAGPAALGLCAPCRSRLRIDGAGLRGLQLGGGARAHAACLHAVWIYAPPMDSVIAALKFRRLDYLGRHLAAAMLAVLGERLAEVELVVPVPLHWRRRLGRGYNQAAEIARPLSRLLGVRCEHLLRRARATRPQTALGRGERRRNPRGAFRAGRRLRGERLLLVDDVVTTGSTLLAAARCLAQAGAGPVTALAAGRALP